MAHATLSADILRRGSRLAPFPEAGAADAGKGEEDAKVGHR